MEEKKYYIDDKNDFLELLKYRRINISRLSRATKISRKTFYSWFDGAVPHINNIQAVANYLSARFGDDKGRMFFYYQESNEYLYLPERKISDNDIELLEWVKNSLGFESKEDGQKKLAIFLNGSGQLDPDFFKALLTLCNRRRV